MPVCFALASPRSGGPAVLYSPVDEKPKRSVDPAELARVRDIVARQDVAVIFDRWEEDWSKLAWLRIEGTASVLWPRADAPSGDHPGSEPARSAGPDFNEGAASVDAERRLAIALLRDRYPQYADQDLEARPLLRIVATRVVAWGDIEGE